MPVVLLSDEGRLPSSEAAILPYVFLTWGFPRHGGLGLCTSYSSLYTGRRPKDETSEHG